MNAAMPPQYPFLSVIEDLPKPANLHVAIRGNQQNQGEEAPRDFIERKMREEREKDSES